MRTAVVIWFRGGVGEALVDAGGRAQLHLSGWRSFQGGADDALAVPRRGDRIRIEPGEAPARFHLVERPAEIPTDLPPAPEPRKRPAPASSTEKVSDAVAFLRSIGVDDAR